MALRSAWYKLNAHSTSGSTPRRNPKDALERRFKRFASQRTSSSQSSSPSKEPLLEKTARDENDADSGDEYTLTGYGDLSLGEDTVWNGNSLRGSFRPKVSCPPVTRRTRTNSNLDDFEAQFSHEESLTYSPMFSDVPPALDFEGFFNSLKAAKIRAARGENPFGSRDNAPSLQPGSVRLVSKSKTPQAIDTSSNDDDEDTENILAPLMKDSAQAARRPLLSRRNY